MTRIYPDIPKVFNNLFPRDYQNNIQNWGFFSKDEIDSNKGKLLMLDIDFGRYCSLNCPGCFRKNNVIDSKGSSDDLTYKELIQVIDDARDLGLRCIKICGAGEPTENIKFLDFIKEMSQKDIGVAAFTKGQVLGSDEATRKLYGKYGINTALDLCNTFHDYKISFMLGFQSFDSNLQDNLVRCEGHTLKRNQALENLVAAGFNKSNPTRLALVNAPLDKQVFTEAFEIYTWARQRNIMPIIAMHMLSGKQLNSEFLSKHNLSQEQQLSLWNQVYNWNIQNNIQTYSQIEEEGLSCMPGSHPCNQLACGLYITANGSVVRCPGYNAPILGNVRQTNIADIWNNSSSKYCGKFNHHCPPKDGQTISTEVYSLKNLSNYVPTQIKQNSMKGGNM
ncbi:MAG: radical SAM protein [Candidatus Pacearchaeota archaeon]